MIRAKDIAAVLGQHRFVDEPNGIDKSGQIAGLSKNEIIAEVFAARIKRQINRIRCNSFSVFDERQHIENGRTARKRLFDRKSESFFERNRKVNGLQRIYPQIGKKSEFRLDT